jgi:oxygen-independent coproporphyrinogen III oxidase
MDTLGIYISVPFCRSKCTYCNFASGVFPSKFHEPYIQRILADMRRSRAFVSEIKGNLPQTVDSIYLGGGTPSVLAADSLGRLFAAIRAEFQVAESAEVTLECAPGQLEDDFLAATVDCGVNRVSFGVQSFIDTEAAVTGRLHTREIALRDIDRTLQAGIRSVNADLIAGLPHQTPESWTESLDVLLSSGVNHASIYMLEVDEDSRLGQQIINGGGGYHSRAVPSEEMVADLYLEAIDVLGESGFTQYEISNFARPRAASVHNRKYWLRQPYLGFGLDAHSMLRTSDGGAVRFQADDDLRRFLDGVGWEGVQPVSRLQSLEEAWFLGLRLNDGVSIADLEGEFGEIDAHRYDNQLIELENLGLVQWWDARVRLTERGRLMSSDVFERFLDGEAVDETASVMVD